MKWHEQYLFKNIINKELCPNFPLFYTDFFTENHVFNLKGDTKNKSYPGIITTMELANSDLNQFLKLKKIYQIR